MRRRGVEMESQRKSDYEVPKLDSNDANSLSVSLEERKREASKPLYLMRYE